MKSKRGEVKVLKEMRIQQYLQAKQAQKKAESIQKMRANEKQARFKRKAERDADPQVQAKKEAKKAEEDAARIQKKRAKDADPQMQAKKAEKKAARIVMQLQENTTTKTKDNPNIFFGKI